jgi:hypothetical protein
MVMRNKPCLSVNKDGASCEVSFRILFPEGLWESIREAGHILVEVNDVTRIRRVILQAVISGV